MLFLSACTSSSDPSSPLTPSPSPSSVNQPSYWTPPLESRWQYQLQVREKYESTGGIDVDICVTPYTGGPCATPTVFDIDLFDLDGVTPNTKAVEAIHERGAHAICYIDAGSIETYRPDYPKFVAFDRRCDGCLIGNPFSKIFSDENWANINDDQGQRGFMLKMNEARVAKCERAGFDGVEFDVVEAYNSGASTTGWRITAATQLTYNKALARIAHEHGLSAALKNDLGQIPELLAHFDYAVNEQCFQYDECDNLRMFVEAGKPVFQVEYKTSLEDFCPKANSATYGFNSISKARDFSLFDRPYTPCR